MRKDREIAIKGFKKQRINSFSPWLAFVMVVLFASFTFLSFFIREAYDETKGQFLERLSEDKRVTDINMHLKTELLAITQKGYVEFAAGERLGMKKPKEEEVFVLK
jgi:hypothetical protein